MSTKLPLLDDGPTLGQLARKMKVPLARLRTFVAAMIDKPESEILAGLQLERAFAESIHASYKAIMSEYGSIGKIPPRPEKVMVTVGQLVVAEGTVKQSDLTKAVEREQAQGTRSSSTRTR